MTRDASKRRAPAREEVGVVVGLVLILVSIVVPGWFAYQTRERRMAARADIFTLLSAGRHFYEEYNVWPSEGSGRVRDPRYGEEVPNAEVINVLRAVSGPGNPGHSMNSKRIVFVEVPARVEGWSGLDEEGSFLDPWGTPYQISIDTDLDGSCDIADSIYARRIGEGMVVWSCGPDGVSDNTDDILSWAP